MASNRRDLVLSALALAACPSLSHAENFPTRAVDLVVAGSREEFRAFIGNEIARLSRVIQDANIRLD